MPLQSNRRILCTMMAYAFLSALPVGAAAQGAGDLPTMPGLHRLELKRSDGPAITYALSVPRAYSPSRPAPLILALHFGVGGGDATGAGGDVLQYLVGPGLADLGAIIVAPDSVRGNWTTEENDKAVIALLDKIVASYAIDKKRVAVTGYSMGGQGTWYFAEKYPERFSAAVPIAGRPPESATGWRLPVFAIHSRNDQVVPFGPTEARIAELQKSGVNAKLVALNGITHYETTRFQDSLKQAVPWLREVWK